MIKVQRLNVYTVVFLATLVTGCGGSEDESASSANISSAAPISASCNNTTYPDTLGYSSLKSKYAGDGQCLPQVQNAEAMRQSAIANCSAGSVAAATTQYSQYKTLVSYVKNIGCS
jgi:hypothetical protein